MNKKFLTFLALICIAAATHRQAFAQKEGLPEGPLLARAPLFSKWTVLIKPITQVATSNGKSSEMKSVITKTKNIYLQEFSDAFGRNWRTWTSDTIQATVSPENGAIVLGNSGDALLAADYSKSDFQGLDWVSADTFVQTSNYKGRKCLVFSSTVNIPAVEGSTPQATGDSVPEKNAGKPLPTTPARTDVRSAVVDFESRLPLYAVNGNMGYTFQFTTPPQAMLQIPAGILQVVEVQSRRAKDMNAKLPKAY